MIPNFSVLNINEHDLVEKAFIYNSISFLERILSDRSKTTKFSGRIISYAFKKQDLDLIAYIFSIPEMKEKCYQTVLNFMHPMTKEMFLFFVEQPGFTESNYYNDFLRFSIDQKQINYFKKLISMKEITGNYLIDGIQSLLSFVVKNQQITTNKLVWFLEYLLSHTNTELDSDLLLDSNSSEVTNLIFNDKAFDIKRNMYKYIEILLSSNNVSLEELLSNDQFRLAISNKKTINDIIFKTRIISNENTKKIRKLFVDEYYLELSPSSKQILLEYKNDAQLLYSIYKKSQVPNLGNEVFNSAIQRKNELKIIQKLINDPNIVLTQAQFKLICDNQAYHELIPKYLSDPKIDMFHDRSSIGNIIQTQNLEVFKFFYDDPRFVVKKWLLKLTLNFGSNKMIHLLLNRTENINEKILLLALEKRDISIIKRIMSKRKFGITSLELNAAIRSNVFDIEVVKLILSVPGFQVYSPGLISTADHPIMTAIRFRQYDAAILITKHESFYLNYDLVCRLDETNNRITRFLDLRKINIIALAMSEMIFHLNDFLGRFDIELSYETNKYYPPIEELICHMSDLTISKLLMRNDIKIDIDLDDGLTDKQKIAEVRKKFPKVKRTYNLLTNLGKFKQIDTVYTFIQEAEEETIETAIDGIFGTYAPFKESGVRKIFNFIFNKSKIMLKKIKVFAKLFIELYKQSDEYNCLKTLYSLLKQKIETKDESYYIIIKEIIKDFPDGSITLSHEILEAKFTPILQIIIDDDVDSLQEFSREINFDFNRRVEKSIYIDINKNELTLLEFASFCGSAKCFRYLMINGAILPQKLTVATQYPIIGQNTEIIRIYEQNKFSFYLHALIGSITVRNKEIFRWIMEKGSIPENSILEYDTIALIINNNFSETFQWNVNLKQMDRKLLTKYLKRSFSDKNSKVFRFILRSPGLCLSFKASNRFFRQCKVENINDLKIFKILLKYKSKLKINDEMIRNLLEREINVEYLYTLLEYGVYDKEIKCRNFINKALKNNEMETVKRLLSYKQYDFQNPNDVHPLYVAVENNSIEQVKLLLSVEGIDVNSTNYGFAPPLCRAIMNRQASIIDLLLEHKGIDVNRQFNSLSPLSLSVLNKDLELFDRLLKNEDIDVNEGNLFYCSCFRGDYEVYEHVKQLECLQTKFDPSLHAFYPLSGGCFSGNLDIVRDLVECEFYDVNFNSIEGPSLLCAISHNHLPIVRYLVEHGADYNYVTEEGLSLISMSIKFQFYDIFIYLLKLKEEDDDESLLNYSVNYGLIEYYSAVLRKFSYKNLNKFLEIALKRNNIKLFDEILPHVEINEEVGSIISDGLIFLIEKDSIDFIELIFKIQNLKLNSGELLHIAVQKKRYDFLRLMCQSEAIEINSVYLGITALGVACKNEDYYMAKELLKYDGIDVNIGKKGL